MMWLIILSMDNYLMIFIKAQKEPCHKGGKPHKVCKGISSRCTTNYGTYVFIKTCENTVGLVRIKKETKCLQRRKVQSCDISPIILDMKQCFHALMSINSALKYQWEPPHAMYRLQTRKILDDSSVPNAL